MSSAAASSGNLTGSFIKSVSPLEDSEAKWVGLQSIIWQDPSGRERKWETSSRKTRKGDADAVAICCLITRPSTRHDPDLLLVSQFRPPVALGAGETGKGESKDITTGLVIEMPAGLIDEGEEGVEGTKRAALRELHEETGYGNKENADTEQVSVLEISPIMFNDPGSTSSNMRLAVVHIHLPSEDSPDPVPEPEETEFIEKRLVKLNGLYDELVKLQNEEKYAVDARLYHFAWALKLSGMVKDLAGQKGKF